MDNGMKPYLKRAWAEVSLPQLRKNVEIIRSLNSDSTEIMAVVKQHVMEQI